MKRNGGNDYEYFVFKTTMVEVVWEIYIVKRVEIRSSGGVRS